MLIVGCSLYSALRHAPPEAAAPLADSEELYAAGPNVSLGALDGDGMFPFTVGASGTYTTDFIASADPISGDLLLEVECPGTANGIFFGLDPDGPDNREYTVLDEVVQINGGFGPDALVCYQQQPIGWLGLAPSRTPAGPFCLTRTGSTIRLWNKLWQDPARTQLATWTALEITPAYFQLNPSAAAHTGRLRFISHPGD